MIMTNRVLVRSWRTLVWFALLGVTIWSCSTVPISGRNQLILVSDSEMQGMSYAQYDTFLMQNKVSKDAGKTAMVRRAGTNIQHAVEKYMSDNKMAGQLSGYKWEFNLVDS